MHIIQKQQQATLPYSMHGFQKKYDKDGCPRQNHKDGNMIAKPLGCARQENMSEICGIVSKQLSKTCISRVYFADTRLMAMVRVYRDLSQIEKKAACLQGSTVGNRWGRFPAAGNTIPILANIFSGEDVLHGARSGVDVLLIGYSPAGHWSLLRLPIHRQHCQGFVHGCMRR